MVATEFAYLRFGPSVARFPFFLSRKLLPFGAIAKEEKKKRVIDLLERSREKTSTPTCCYPADMASASPTADAAIATTAATAAEDFIIERDGAFKRYKFDAILADNGFKGSELTIQMTNKATSCRLPTCWRWRAARMRC